MMKIAAFALSLGSLFSQVGFAQTAKTTKKTRNSTETTAAPNVTTPFPCNTAIPSDECDEHKKGSSRGVAGGASLWTLAEWRFSALWGAAGAK